MGLFSKKQKDETVDAASATPEEKLAQEVQKLDVGDELAQGPGAVPGGGPVVEVAIKGDGTVGPADEADKENGTVVRVQDIPDGPKKLEENPHMRDVGTLNTLADKAVESAGALYRTVEIVHRNAIPLDLVVSSVVTAVEDFGKLKDELHNFQREGRFTMEDILDQFGDITYACNQITRMLEERREQSELVVKLDDLVMMVQNFMGIVSYRCKELQRLRKKTANTWLATTSVASVTVGGAAAAMCVLSGGTALPVLAPIIAFGAGSTAVATASHVAFSPSLGAQIKDMDDQIKKLDDMRMQAGIVGKKVEAKRLEGIIHGKGKKFLFW